jgi:hypothetical protein
MSRETVKMLYRGMRALIEARRAFEGQENAFGGREFDVEGSRRHQKH